MQRDRMHFERIKLQLEWISKQLKKKKASTKLNTVIADVAIQMASPQQQQLCSVAVNELYQVERLYCQRQTTVEHLQSAIDKYQDALQEYRVQFLADVQELHTKYPRLQQYVPSVFEKWKHIGTALCDVKVQYLL